MKNSTNNNDADLHFQDVIDALTSHIAILDEKAVIIAVNQAWREFGDENGFTLKNGGIGKNYLEVCDAATGEDMESAQQVAAAIRKIQSNEVTEEYVEYPCHSHAQKRWFQVKISKFKMGKGKLIIIHQNVTARKNAEENLRESEWKFRSVIEQSSEGITIIDTDGKIIEWNHQEELITGLSKDQVLGRYIWDVQAESSAAENPIQVKQMMQNMVTDLLKNGNSPWSGKPTEVEITRPDGSQITMQSVIFAIKHNHGFMACSINRDISIYKKAKEAQLLSEKKMHTYMHYSPVIALIVDPTGKFVDVNPEACARLGYSEKEFYSMNLLDLIPADQSEYADQLIARLIDEKQISGEIQILTKDKNRLILNSNAVTLPEGEFMIMCSDITEIKQTHEKLQESESFLESILDNIPSLITVKKAQDLTYFKVNKPAEDYFDKSNQEIIGKHNSDFFQKEEAEINSAQDRLALSENTIVDVTNESIMIKNRQKRILHEKKIPMFDEKGIPRFVLGIAEDITEQINLQKEADAHMARLEAISQLSTSLQIIQTLDELYPMVLETLLKIVESSTGCIWIYKNDKDILLPIYPHGNIEENSVLFGEPLKAGMGIPGMVYVSHKPYISRDYDSDPHFSENKRGLLKKKVGGVTLPLRTTNSIIGVISIIVDSKREITDDDVKLLTTLSEIAGNAIQNISLRDQTEQRLMRITALSEIDKTITSSFDIQVSLEILVSNVINQLKADASAVLLFNPHSQLLEYSNGQGFQTSVAEKLYLRLGESFAGKVASTRELLAINDLNESDNPLFHEVQQKEGFSAYFGVPLVAKGQLKGVLEAFMRTPFEPDNDWINFLLSLAEQASIAIDNMQMFDNMQRSNTELSLAYNATIEGWSRALDLRDKETEGHTLRVTELTEHLARAFRLPDNEIKYIRWGALLHDIGKLGVPDGILLKPGPLSDEEWEVMRMHPRYAFEMLSPISYLNQAIDIPYCHHEKWDGTGYPRGLSKEQIPLAARIFAVVDIWDALRSDRPYRKAWPEEKVIDHLRSLADSHLDPKVVEFCLNSGVFNRKSE